MGCCGLVKGDDREEWCKDVHSLTYNVTTPCYDKLNDTITKSARYSGAIGLFFALTLLVLYSIHAIVRHRNQMKEEATVDL